MKKKLLTLIFITSNIIAGDIFFGYEMLSKVDETKFTCKKWLSYTDILLCEQKKQPKNNSTNLVVIKKSKKIIAIAHHASGDSSSIQNAHEAWTLPMYNKLIKQYGKIFTYEMGMFCPEYRAHIHNNTIILKDHKYYPSVIIDNDLINKYKMP